MNSGSSAPISLGAQVLPATFIRSSYQTSRCWFHLISAPVRLQTMIFCTLEVSGLVRASSTLAFSGVRLPPRTPSSAVITTFDLQSMMRPARASGEAAEDHRVDRADAGAGEHGDHGLGDHRHVDGHYVAAVHVLPAQGVGELADLLVELAVGDFLVVGGIVAFPDDRHLVAAFGEVTVEAVVRHVEGAVGEPLDVHVMVVEGGLLDLLERLDPVDPLGLLAPEAVGVDDGLLVHRLVGGFVGEGPCHRFRVHGVQGCRRHGFNLGT